MNQGGNGQQISIWLHEEWERAAISGKEGWSRGWTGELEGAGFCPCPCCTTHHLCYYSMREILLKVSLQKSVVMSH